MRNKLLDFLKTSEYKLADRNYILEEIVPLFEFKSGDTPQEKGVAICWCEDNMLHASGLFYDSELFNNSTYDNDKTWEKGDVFEFIFQKDGHEDYYEFHATPNGKKLEYHIPSSRTIRETPHEKKVCNCYLTIKNSYENNLWYSELIIPLTSLGISNLNNCKCLFARQNYKLPNIKLEVTSSRIFPTTIHAPEFWHNIVAKKERS